MDDDVTACHCGGASRVAGPGPMTGAPMSPLRTRIIGAALTAVLLASTVAADPAAAIRSRLGPRRPAQLSQLSPQPRTAASVMRLSLACSGALVGTASSAQRRGSRSITTGRGAERSDWRCSGCRRPNPPAGSGPSSSTPAVLAPLPSGSYGIWARPSTPRRYGHASTSSRWTRAGSARARPCGASTPPSSRSRPAPSSGRRPAIGGNFDSGWRRPATSPGAARSATAPCSGTCRPRTSHATSTCCAGPSETDG